MPMPKHAGSDTTTQKRVPNVNERGRAGCRLKRRETKKSPNEKWAHPKMAELENGLREPETPELSSLPRSASKNPRSSKPNEPSRHGQGPHPRTPGHPPTRQQATRADVGTALGIITLCRKYESLQPDGAMIGDLALSSTEEVAEIGRSKTSSIVSQLLRFVARSCSCVEAPDGTIGVEIDTVNSEWDANGGMVGMTTNMRVQGEFKNRLCLISVISGHSISRMYWA
ncbi:hypothetical protein C8R44DRAFT_744439 [Mycena epipterygia]|nr:hypothetical protein C8R44DRAFT_744439 [Mycena epipterygia]